MVVAALAAVEAVVVKADAAAKVAEEVAEAAVVKADSVVAVKVAAAEQEAESALVAQILMKMTSN